MRNRIKMLALATVFTLGAGAANAVEIVADVTLNDGVAYETDGIIDDIVLGSDMAGMIVRAYFSSDPTDYQAALWAPYTGTGAADDGFAGFLENGSGPSTLRADSAWYLYLQGTTIEGVWHLHNRTANPIVALEMIAREGGATFDVWPFNPITGTADPNDHDTVEGTLNSNDGNAFRNRFYGTDTPPSSECAAYVANTPTAAIAQCADTNDPAFSGDEVLDPNYYDILNLIGDAAAGDEYTRLFINIPNGGLHKRFADATAAGTEIMGWELAFRSDTDLATSEIDETTVETPEPMTIALFGAGLLGLGALRRFRRKAGK